MKSRWLFRRFAIKEAVRYWLCEQTGVLLYPTDIGVDFTDEYAPFVYGWWCDEAGYIAQPPAFAVFEGDRSVYVEVQGIAGNAARKEREQRA